MSTCPRWAFWGCVDVVARLSAFVPPIRSDPFSYLVLTPIAASSHLPFFLFVCPFEPYILHWISCFFAKGRGAQLVTENFRSGGP